MADFSTIIQEINNEITTNGVGAITGAKLNEVLRDMIAAVNAEKQDVLQYYSEDSANERVNMGGTASLVAQFLENILLVSGNWIIGNYGGSENHILLSNINTGTKLELTEDTVEIIANGDIVFRVSSEDGVTINDKSVAVVDDIPNVSGKADKVIGATNGNFAGLDASGNLTDSGSKASDFATAAQGTKADTAYQKPSGGIPASDLSTAVQTSLGKADTAVQQVTVGTTTTGNAGTNASVTNSGTATNPVLDFTIPRGADGANGQDGADAVNPFKGWFASANALPANPAVGDYAYVKGANASDPVAIYECTTAGTWSDSGRTADTSNVQTFASGEEVNETPIDNTHLASPTQGSIPLALDVVSKLNKLGVTAYAKDLIIALFRKCAFVTDDAGDCIDDLEEEFAGTRILMSITATMPQTYEVHESDNLDVLRNYLTVTANYDDGSSNTVSTYTLSGTLMEGTSVITVSYGGFSTTVNVTVLAFTVALVENDIVRKTNTIYKAHPTGYVIPYTSPSNARCCYPYFDKNIKAGTYDIEIDCTYSTVHIGIQAMSQHCLDLVAIEADYSGATPGNPSIDSWDSGWITFTNGHAQVTIPEYTLNQSGGEVKVVRFAFKQNYSGSTISNDFVINSLTLTKIS